MITKKVTKHQTLTSYMIRIGLCIAIILLSKGVWNMYHTYRASIERRELVEERFAILAERIADTSARVELLETPEGREMEIRQLFNVVKAGEQLVVVLPAATPEEVSLPTLPWYRKIIKMVWPF